MKEAVFTAHRHGAPRSRRFGLLASLYVSQAIPLGFFIEAVPAIGRTLGLSLRDVGLIQALALPFMIKFLWAPWIDGVGSSRVGHYRSWLIPLQATAVALVVAIAFLDPVAQLGLLLTLGGLFMLVAATQDIASDGLAVRILARDERGIGNGFQVGGYYLGQIVGGGLLLVLFGRFGWRFALLGMALFLTLPLFVLRRFREPEGERRESRRVDFGALGRFFTRSGAGYWIPVLLLYRAGETMAVTMARPMFVDLGVSLEEIGLIVGLGASVAAFAGAFVGGATVERWGRRRTLVIFAGLTALSILGFALPATGRGGAAAIWAVSIAVAFSGGMGTTALYTRMMDRVDGAAAGTEFTLQQSLAAIGPLVGVALSGALAEAVGYVGHFAVCAALALTAAALVALDRDPSTA